MRVAHELRIQDKCRDCGLQNENSFCQLPESILAEFEALKITRAYPKGTTLFNEGQPSNAVYMLCQGKVKLSTCSQDGKIIILGIAEPGDGEGTAAGVLSVKGGKNRTRIFRIWQDRRGSKKALFDRNHCSLIPINPARSCQSASYSSCEPSSKQRTWRCAKDRSDPFS